MKRFLLALLLVGCDQSPPTRIYLACHCASGAPDCHDTLVHVATIATEYCPKGAIGEVLCTGPNCPTRIAGGAPADMSGPQDGPR